MPPATKRPVTAKPAPKPVEPRKLKVAYIGNFEPPESTENHLKRALLHNGHEVQAWQENDLRTWENLGELPTPKVDFVLWTMTGWDWEHLGVTEQWAFIRMRRMLRFAADAKIPVVSYHLDKWWDLSREHLLSERPFFEAPLVITADGGNAHRFAQLAINHVWFPPGVSLAECELGSEREEFKSPLAFVGSWNGGYHAEHHHRHDLVQWLHQNYRRDCAFYPKPGEHAVRGAPLRDLYQSVDVLIGDSCLAGSGAVRYASDRIPETTGRGGFLLHPRVEGVTDGQPWDFGPTWTEGQHLECWNAGDWDALGSQIEWALARPSSRKAMAEYGRDHTMEFHTYEVRMKQLVELLEEKGLL